MRASRKLNQTALVMFITMGVFCSNCTLVDRVFNKGAKTVDVAKPRLHKSWYKDSRWHRRLHVGKYQLRVFEKSGVKKVKMRS